MRKISATRSLSDSDTVPAQPFSGANDIIAATLTNAPLIESVPMTSLQPYKRTLRKHGAPQRRHLAASLAKYGQVVPILIDVEGTIIDGHGVHAALVELGYTSILAIRVTHLSEASIRKLRLSLNKLSEGAEWDPEQLRIELQELSLIDLDTSFTIPGFEVGELDALTLPDTKHRQTDDDDLLPPHDPGRTITCRPGDLWQLGEHRLICGNALDAATYDALLKGRKVAMVQSDPPFNVPITGHVSGLGRARHREFAMASGEMSKTGFRDFLATSMKLAADHAMPGAVLQFFMDWRHMSELLGAGEAADLSLLNLCVWVKDNGGMGSFYRSRHELVFVFKKKGASHRNNVELGRHGRYRTNVWEYPGMNSLQEGRDTLLAAHPTVKPVAMIADAICDSTARGDAVLDPFAGSGTIFLAAARTGRHGFGIEIDPAYCETAIERWEHSTGLTAIHEETGRTLEALAEERGSRVRQRRRPVNLKARSANNG